MKNKMTAALYLIADLSLYRELGDSWERFSNSYQCRNDVIHRGENATEDDARQALDMARRVVAIMAAIPTPAAAP